MAAPRQQATPSGGSTTHFKVTPENVVDLATIFAQAADVLAPVVQRLDIALTIHKPWLGDPVSRWAQEQFNKYFVENPDSVINVLTQNYRQHSISHRTLKEIADQYHKTDELNKRMMEDRGSDS